MQMDAMCSIVLLNILCAGCILVIGKMANPEMRHLTLVAHGNRAVIALNIGVMQLPHASTSRLSTNFGKFRSMNLRMDYKIKYESPVFFITMLPRPIHINYFIGGLSRYSKQRHNTYIAMHNDAL